MARLIVTSFVCKHERVYRSTPPLEFPSIALTVLETLQKTRGFRSRRTPYSARYMICQNYKPVLLTLLNHYYATLKVVSETSHTIYWNHLNLNTSGREQQTKSHVQPVLRIISRPSLSFKLTLLQTTSFVVFFQPSLFSFGFQLNKKLHFSGAYK